MIYKMTHEKALTIDDIMGPGDLRDSKDALDTPHSRDDVFEPAVIPILKAMTALTPTLIRAASPICIPVPYFEDKRTQLPRIR